MSASERAVLGCALIDPIYLDQARAKLLKSSHFGDERHKLIFKAMCVLRDRGMDMDIISLQDYMRQSESLDLVGGIGYLSSLDVDIPDIGHFETYVSGVRTGAVRRLIGSASFDLKRISESDLSLEEMVGSLHGTVHEITQSATKGIDESTHASEAIQEFIDASDGSSPNTIPSGYIELDDKLTMSRGDLVVVAGRPGMGKTSLALNILVKIATIQSRHCGIFSLEMSAAELGSKILADVTGIPITKTRHNMLSDAEREKVIQAVEKMKSSPLYIDDTAPVTTIDGIVSKAKGMALKNRLDVLCVDYMQLIVSGKGDLRQQVTDVSRRLKLLARELGIVIMAVSQLSRAPEHRADKRPGLSDLRESGSIEQDANAVLFVYRPGYYLEQSNQVDDSKGRTELLLKKNRAGETGTIILTWKPELTSFRGMSFPGQKSP